MKYHNITHDDMLNGTGLRVVLWVSGCSHKCKGCQNPITWDCESGIEFDRYAENEIFKELENDYIEGLTLSGGDPLYTKNRNTVTKLVKKVKEFYPNKNIWLYTGYTWEKIKDLETIMYVDVVVDGKFIEKFRDNNLHWRGSSNQRIIDVKKTLKSGKVVIYGE